MRLRYPYIRSQLLNANVQLAFDIQSEDLDILTDDGNLPVYSDEVRVLRLSGDVSQLFADTGAVLDAAAILSFGLESFGARTANDADPTDPLSREGADANYTKFELLANYTHPLPGDLAFALSGKAQSSFGDPLVTSEQVGLIGPRALSTFDSGSLVGDSGWVVRGEFSKTTAFGGRFPIEVSPYLFAATGAAYLERPTEFEEDSIRASSYGLGVDLLVRRDPRYSDASLRAEFGKGYRDDTGEDDDRLTVYASFRF